MKQLVASVLFAFASLAVSGCSKGTTDGNGPSVVPPPPVPVITVDPNLGLDVRKMTADAQSYAIHYGPLDDATINVLKTYPLVIVHPYNANADRNQIWRIKQGVNPNDSSDNPVVLCYISIGEDTRTYGLTDEDLRKDPRFVGDGSGPSIDPRGAGASGRALTGLNLKGTPTNGGFASYYLNDNAVRCKGAPDKMPDINRNFVTRFVNAGDPTWYNTLKIMVMNSDTHTPPGLQELLTTGTGRGLGCDGVFLDTVDTAAPNRYTSCESTNQTASEWTAAGFSAFMQQLRADFPGKVILQNRGLFFFDPREPHYQVSARGAIDLGFFESYRLDNDTKPEYVYFHDNKYNSAPKLMAEANRPDGFKVLSLGYASGFNSLGQDVAKPNIDIQTLLGKATLGYQELVTDFQEAHAVGFRHYLTSASVDFPNDFVKNHADYSDLMPPIWSSTFNATYNPPEPPTPRIGIQKAEGVGSGAVTVSWDVALDMNKVSYVLYYKKASPFDFVTDPNLTAATRLVLTPSVGISYDQVWNAADPFMALQAVYPYQATITGLTPGAQYYFLVHAIDRIGNEDANHVVLTATP
ncbi:MAG: fibronectin type III domain-containing protein [Geobacter sp.]|nr:fibronectin type III domain-containing protein [Geobacter sp.]